MRVTFLGVISLFLLLLVGFIQIGVAQQRPTVSHRLQVRILLPDNAGTPEVIRVNLDSERNGLPIQTRNLLRENYTEFTGLPNGEYVMTISVDDDKKFESYTERFSLRSAFSQVRQINAFVKLRATRDLKEAPGTISATGTVSVADAANPAMEIPKDARKAYEKGQKKAMQGKSEDAIKAYREAISEYPRYLDAINNLAVEYMKLSRYDEAAAELKKAVEMVPNAPLPHLNLGMVYNEKQDFKLAIEELTRAIELDFENPLSHFQMGIAAFQLNQINQAQMEFELTVKKAGQKIPVSRLYLAEIYKRQSRVGDALNQLESFLRENDEKNQYTPIVKEEIKKLQGK
jgi:tetratricopeptide (TPR) repeat protein